MQRVNSSRSRGYWLLAAWVVFGLCVAHSTYRAWRWDMPFAPRRDFVQLYAGARCVLAQQSPYDTKCLEAKYLAGGGLREHLPPWKWELPLYPPSALLFGVPFAGMSYATASGIWFWMNLCLLFGGIALLPLLVESRWRAVAVLLAALVVWYPTTTLVLGMGQPAALTLALLFFAVVATLRSWPAALAVIAFTLAVLLKAQLTLPILLYLLLTRRYRKIAALALLSWVVISLACVAWMHRSPATANWSAELKTNIASSLATGGSANPEESNPTVPTFTNLQAVTSLFFSGARAYNLATYAFVLPVGLWWLAGIWRAGWSRERDLLAIAGAAALALLPVYSFYYNLTLLALCVPAVAWLLVHRLQRGIAVFLCLMPVAFWNLQLHVQHFVMTHPQFAITGRLGTLLLVREYPIATALSALVLVAALWACAPRARDAALEKTAR